MLDALAGEIRILFLRLVEAGGGGREDFENDDGILQRTSGEVQWAARHRGVRVVVSLVAILREMDGDVRVVRTARLALKQVAECDDNALAHLAMTNGPAGHRMHGAIDVFMLHGGQLFVVQVLHDGNKSDLF